MNFHDWLFEREIKQIILETGINEIELENQLLSEVAWLAPMVAGKLIDRVTDRQPEDQESLLQKFYNVFMKAVKAVGIVAAIAATFYFGMKFETLRKMMPALPALLMNSILGRGKDFLKTAAEKVAKYIPGFAAILKSVTGFEVGKTPPANPTASEPEASKPTEPTTSAPTTSGRLRRMLPDVLRSLSPVPLPRF